MTDKQHFIDYLQSVRHAVLATSDHDGNPWTTNLFIGASSSGRVYFISSEDAEHSLHILQNASVSLAAAWFDENDVTNRKGVQIFGTCHKAESNDEINEGVRLHNEHYPVFANRITVDWIREGNSAVWVIEPTRAKYWDDEHFGNNGVREIEFSV